MLLQESNSTVLVAIWGARYPTSNLANAQGSPLPQTNEAYCISP